MMGAAGTPAPGFTLTSDRGESLSLDDYRGRRLVLYFFPAAFTPGCTAEACDFGDRYDAFLAAGYDVLGVSPDPPERLAEFRAAYRLPFPLASDPDHAVAEAYGAWGTKRNYGREYQGVIRSTFVIGADGIVALARRNVRAAGHAARLADAL
jgi:peroxiredoxin Q/BCP